MNEDADKFVKENWKEFNRFGLSASTESPYKDCFITKEVAMESVLKTQIGGAHYKDNAIQPIEFISSNNLGFIAGSVIKYTVRADKKGGLEDWKKIIHYAQIELETKYGVKSEVRYEQV